MLWNIRGISLLLVAGKVLACMHRRILNLHM